MADRLKVVVLDDDPTGSQTVHSCALLLRWDAASLRRGLADPSPLLFILANTRALEPGAAAARLRQICAALRPALAEAQAAGLLDRWLIVSRGDSTLRGHFPLEVEVLEAELGPFDATLLVPAFLPGGRTTRHGVHLLQGEPVHTTAFARDRLFGYQTSDLPDWVAEKSGGRIAATAVQRLSLAELDRAAAPAGFQQLCARLAGLEGNVCVAVDGERPQQLAALGAAVRELTAPAAAERWGRPRRFLFQSAASLLNGLVEIGPPPLDQAALVGLRRRDGAGRPLPGLVLVGSHVPLADVQLERLLAEPGCAGLELPVAKLARLLEGPAPGELLASLERQWGDQLEGLLAARAHAGAVHQSRGAGLSPCRRAPPAGAGVGGPDGAAGGPAGAPAGLPDQQGGHHQPHPAGRWPRPGAGGAAGPAAAGVVAGAHPRRGWGARAAGAHLPRQPGRWRQPAPGLVADGAGGDPRQPAASAHTGIGASGRQCQRPPACSATSGVSVKRGGEPADTSTRRPE